MGIAFKQLKVYLKLALIGVVVFFAGCILVMNRGNTVKVWFFRSEDHEVNVVWLMLLTAIGSIITFWVLCAVSKIWKEFRRVRREAQTTERAKRLDERAESLDEREQRIDAKIHEALSDTSGNEAE